MIFSLWLLRPTFLQWRRDWRQTSVKEEDVYPPSLIPRMDLDSNTAERETGWVRQIVGQLRDRRCRRDRQTDSELIINMENGVKMVLFFCSVFITSVHTVKWTDVAVELGQNATLNCSLDKDVFWYMQLLGGGPVQILKIYSKDTDDADYYKTFIARFSVKPGNRLVIHNATVDDMRFYYCTDVLNNTTSEIFHLVSAGDLPPRDPHHQKDAPFWPNGPLTSVSLALNVLLITALAAVCCFAARRLNRPRHHGNDFSPLTSDPAPGNPAPALYEEIPVHNVQSQTSPRGGAAPRLPPAPGSSLGSECIYSTAQLPVPTAQLPVPTPPPPPPPQ